MKNKESGFNIHDFANALLKPPKNTPTMFHNDNDYIRSFGVFTEIFKNCPNRETSLLLIERGLLAIHCVVINPKPENLNTSGGYIDLK